MNDISIERVSTGKMVREFIELPHRLYTQMPYYSPSLYLERAMLLDSRKSGFWKQPTNRCAYWLARRSGVAVGRISAQTSATEPVGLKRGTGMFGCLDAIDDADVVKALLATAQDWLKLEGCIGMFGPCTLDINMEPGILVEGFDQPPMTLSPWHPDYLGHHLDSSGLDRLQDLHNWHLQLPIARRETAERAEPFHKRLAGLHVRYPDRASHEADIQILCDIFNDGWQSNWGFVPLTPDDLADLRPLMKWLVPRRVFKIVELNETPVAAMLLVPNLFELYGTLAPHPGWIGWVRLAWRALTHRFRSGRIIITGLAKHLQGTVTGAAIIARLVEEMVEDCETLRGESVEAGWVLESNKPMIAILNRFGFRPQKTFRVYGMDFVPTSRGSQTDIKAV